MIGLCKHGVYELNSTAFMRFGQVIGLLGILMLIDGNFKVKAPLFLKLGQNTLPIYVIHVIILYGGIFGIGLKPDVINLNLSPYASIGVSVIAMLSFTVMVKFIEPLENVYNSVLEKVFFWRKKN
jgi:fucose 4-O-acetylase-like acetyltransferase